jgi:pyridoxal phosphate enzyme (YggS family)
MTETAADAATLADTGVATAVEGARERIAAAAARAGRDPQSVRLVAVTKTVATARIREAVVAGVGDVGENKVQEALAKREELGDVAAWHLIGHLQTNKAGRAAGGAFAWVHSVDSERIAHALDSRRPAELSHLDVLIEVELTGLPGRAGVDVEGLPELAELVMTQTSRLRLRGLMTMAGPPGDAAATEAAQRVFARLRGLRDDLASRMGTALPELSMGMSGDFEVAVEEGSTMVRLGSALFGARPPRG